MGFALRKPEDTAGSAAPAIIIGLFVAFGGVLYGYALLFTPCRLHYSNLYRVIDMIPVQSAAFSP